MNWKNKHSFFYLGTTGLESTILANEQLQTHVLDRAATETGKKAPYVMQISTCVT